MTDMKEWDCVHKVIYANSMKDSGEAYAKWATKYDEDLSALKFVANVSMVKHSFDLIKNEESTLMLDIAAGTGNTALYFKNAGFKGMIDAIEMNASMLDVAKQKNLYRNTICTEVTAVDPLPVPDNTYDIATIGASMIVNHIPQDCIPHVVNALKVGGLLIFNSRNTEPNAEYQKVLWSITNRLVEEKKIAVVKDEAIPYYESNCRESGEPMMAQLYVCRRLK